MTRLGQDGARRPGRPRDENAHDLIVHAALESFVEEGLAAASMEGIAARAGVGKATIYRRWHSKEDLIGEAITRCAESVEAPNTGSTRGDLICLMSRLHSDLSCSMGGQIFPRMVGELWNGTGLGKDFARAVILPRRQLLVDVLQEGIERGELRAGIDPQLVTDALSGAIIVGRMMEGADGDLPGEMLENLVDQVLTGILV